MRTTLCNYIRLTRPHDLQQQVLALENMFIPSVTPPLCAPPLNDGRWCHCPGIINQLSENPHPSPLPVDPPAFAAPPSPFLCCPPPYPIHPPPHTHTHTCVHTQGAAAGPSMTPSLKQQVLPVPLRVSSLPTQSQSEKCCIGAS